MSKSQDFLAWIDARFPLTKMWEEHLSKYYAPKNFNFWYFFGSLALLVLVIQIVTGIFLTMNYKPDATLAFGSVEYIMRDVYGGWIIRYMHSTGASAFFIVVYLHMFRGLMYGSFKQPRELVWIFGMLIYLALMAEAFMGYLLPWGPCRWCCWPWWWPTSSPCTKWAPTTPTAWKSRRTRARTASRWTAFPSIRTTR